MLYCIEPLIRYTEEGTKNLLERYTYVGLVLLGQATKGLGDGLLGLVHHPQVYKS